MHRTQNKHYGSFPANRENWFLNQFHFQFYELRCYPLNQPPIPPVFEHTQGFIIRCCTRLIAQ